MKQKTLAVLSKFLKFSRGYASSQEQKMQWNLDVKAVADALYADESEFDAEYFIAACGGRFE